MARRYAVLWIAAAMVLAGCIGGADDDEALEEQTIDAGAVNELGQRVVQHVGTDPVPDSGDVPRMLVRLADTGQSGAEPTLGVTSDGTIFTNPFTGNNDLLRSTDHGQNWERVGGPVANPKVNLDPWMWVDPDTDRVFNAPLYVACSWVAWSDDQGENWDFNPAGGCGIPAHDHQKLTTGPPAPGVETDGYPNVVYYAYNGAFRGDGVLDTLDGTWVAPSYDGGRTFELGAKVFEPSSCKSGINGPVAVGPDGVAYIGHATCQGTKVAASLNSGGSWEVVHHFDDIGMYRGLAVNPDLDTDPNGNAYLATPGGDGLVYMSVGRNMGQLWSEPVPVTPPAVNFTVFSVISVGDPGHVAIAYLGTDADVSTWDRPEPSYASDDTTWHLYLTTTTNGLDDQPTFTTVQVTPDDDPVQRGCVWLWGGGQPCRNMLDFIDMVEHDGRPYVVFSDGCDACQTAEDSRERLHRLAILEEGPSLVGGVLQPLVELAESA